jgi:hypothetical protein
MADLRQEPEALVDRLSALEAKCGGLPWRRCANCHSPEWCQGWSAASSVALIREIIAIERD